MRRRRDAKKWQQVSHDMRKAANSVEHLCRALALENDVQPDVSKTGRVVLRCSACNKVCYQDRRSAEQAVESIPDPMVAYYSVACGFFHLATQRQPKH